MERIVTTPDYRGIYLYYTYGNFNKYRIQLVDNNNCDILTPDILYTLCELGTVYLYQCDMKINVLDWYISSCGTAMYLLTTTNVLYSNAIKLIYNTLNYILLQDYDDLPEIYNPYTHRKYDLDGAQLMCLDLLDIIEHWTIQKLITNQR